MPVHGDFFVPHGERNLKLDVPEYATPPEALPLPSLPSLPSLPRPAPTARPAHWSDWFSGRPHRALWLLAFMLLALAQVLFAGYELGVGNQTIQIPFLRHWQDPRLFANDPVVRTAADYPTYFFRLLALLIPGDSVPTAYFALHLLTAFAVLAAAAGMARAMFRDRLSGGIIVLLLVAGHHRALAGDEFYSTGFTHTFAVFPLAIAALLLFYRDHPLAAFALVGATFNLHALTAAYLAVMFGTWAVWEVLRGRVRWTTVLGWLAVFSIAALPTIVLMLSHRQSFGEEWIRVTRIRSADHSFPSSWWAVGSADIPRFAILAALAGLCLSFVTESGLRRKTIAIGVATWVLFLIGIVFSEIWPWAPVLRAQLFRASRIFLVVALVHVAYGIARCLRSAASCPEHGPRPGLRRALVGFLALFTLVALAVPTQASLLPWVLLIATVVALALGRLSGVQAALAGASLLVCLVAWRTIQFPIPGLDEATNRPTLAGLWHAVTARPPMTSGVVIALFAGTILWCFSWLRLAAVLRGVCVATGVIAVAAIGHYLYRQAGPGADDAGAWDRVQRWAKRSTPVDAVFLTATQPGGFRVDSDRAVVAEWRDGTQAYFTADFATDWLARVQRLQPRLQYDSAGRNVLLKGRPLESLDDDELIALCRPIEAGGLGATHIVLENTAKRRNLIRVYRNDRYSVYVPKPANTGPPDDAPDKDRWAAQEKFVRETCLPNIEKYRKGDLAIAIVDDAGTPVAGLPFHLDQTRHAFNFGCSLPFFKRPDAPKVESFMPPQVDPRELSAFLKLFNYSQIGFSGKWGYIESVEGKRDYTDLDLYLDFCRRNGVTPEFHFLSGYEPLWLRRRPRAEQAAKFIDHAKDMVTRYGDQIPYWQVVNEEMLLEYSPPVFESIRKLNPQIKLGISHCAQFWSTDRNGQRRDMLRGLADLKWLKSKGVTVDYFAFHGHRPMGVWPDARDMYFALDTFAAEVPKIHVSEFTVPMGQPITGPVRSGRWNDELQAEYYERFYTVCFSHPAVEVINMWGIGPITWQDGSGLLDDQYKPKPAFDVLRALFTHKWHTESSGTLSASGQIAQRAFYGEYEVTLNLPDGQTARTTIAFPLAAQVAPLTLVLDRDAATLRSR